VTTALIYPSDAAIWHLLDDMAVAPQGSRPAFLAQLSAAKRTRAGTKKPHHCRTSRHKLKSAGAALTSSSEAGVGMAMRHGKTGLFELRDFCS
jgi:hypothetical protein